MHPALSVIAFTVASGAGYGLLAWLGLGALLDAVPPGRLFGGLATLLALALVSGGLLSSTLHLGRPERAWRAISQWRSSWLSREGVLALLSYLPALPFAAIWILGYAPSSAWKLLGVLTAIAALATVFATGMIYASLKPIRQWRGPATVANYLSLAVASGAVWLAALLHAAGHPARGWELLALVVLIAAYLIKLTQWRIADRSRPLADAGSATGLGALGRVRLLESPHTADNYLLQEMGFRIARKHAERLRQFAVLFGFVVPFVTLLIGTLTGPVIGGAAELLGALGMLGGLLIERWLFFAEATHTVTLYYGAQAA
jgi:DMSO reductase anchor subunit